MKSIDKDLLISRVTALQEVREKLAVLKNDEMALRKSVANTILGVKDSNEYGEARKVSQVIGGSRVEVATSESLEIIDKDALVNLYIDGELSDEEQEVLRLKPDITVSRARDLDEDSDIWEYIFFKPSPTPTVTITPIKD